MRESDQIERELHLELEQLAQKYAFSNMDDSDSHLSLSDQEDFNELLEAMVFQTATARTNNGTEKAEDGLEDAFELFQSSMIVVTGSDQKATRTNFNTEIMESHDCDLDRSGENTQEVDSNVYYELDDPTAISYDDTIDPIVAKYNTMSLPHQQHVKSKDMAWLVEDEPETENKTYISDYLQEIEREMKEEELFKRTKRREFQRKRDILISKERVNCARLHNAARSLQSVAQSFLERTRARRDEKYRKGIHIMIHVVRYMLLTHALQRWVVNVTCSRAAERISRCVRLHLKRQLTAYKSRIAYRDTCLQRLIHNQHHSRTKHTFKQWITFVVRRKFKEELLRLKTSSAISVQCIVRAYFSRAKMECLRDDLRKTSAATIQLFWRRSVQRKLHCLSKVNAAVTIQKEFRRQRIRQKIIQVLQTNQSHHDEELDNLFGDDVDDILNNMVGEDFDDSLNMDWKPELPEVTRCLERPPSNFISSIGTRTSMENSDVILGPLEGEGQGQPGRDDHASLMDEWNITDKRVVDSMMRRKSHMNHIKTSNERSRKLSNPLVRFKKIMRGARKSFR